METQNTKKVRLTNAEAKSLLNHITRPMFFDSLGGEFKAFVELIWKELKENDNTISWSGEKVHPFIRFLKTLNNKVAKELTIELRVVEKEEVQVDKFTEQEFRDNQNK